MLLRGLTVPAVSVLLAAVALGYCALTGLAETPVREPVPPGDEIQWATVAIQGFTGHECGRVVEANRLSDGSIRAKCDNGEWFRIDFMNGAPVAVRCPATQKHGIMDCQSRNRPASAKSRAIDGTRQWAYQGTPLYVYHEDKAPGDVEGDNKNDGSWHVVKLKGS